MPAKKRYADHEQVWKAIEKAELTLREAEKRVTDRLATAEDRDAEANRIISTVDNWLNMPTNREEFRRNVNKILYGWCSDENQVFVDRVKVMAAPLRWPRWVCVFCLAIAYLVLAYRMPQPLHIVLPQIVLPATPQPLGLANPLKGADSDGPTNPEVTGIATGTLPPVVKAESEVDGCWMKMTGVSRNSGFASGTMNAGQSLTFDHLPVEVRSGCPGNVHYWKNGERIYPPNASGTPKKSEVVDIQ